MCRRLFAAALVAIASTLLSPAAAQQQRPGSITTDSGNPRDRMVEDKNRSIELDRVKRDAEKPKGHTDPAPSFPIIKEDFERIQIVNSDVLQAAPSGAAPDYSHISAAAAEIKRRAMRLRANIFPAEPDKKTKDKAPAAEEQKDFKALLAALDDTINAFVHNPMFGNINVVDVESSAKARRDLERVIKLSDRIEREAEKLKKTGGG